MSRRAVGVAGVMLSVAVLLLAVRAWHRGHRLHSAAENCDVASLSRALDAGDDPNRGISDGWRSGITPLMLAAECGCVDGVDLLLSRGADANGETSAMFAAMHYAVHGSRREIIESLIASGGDVDAINGSGMTALEDAAHRGNMDMVRWLVKLGANVNGAAGPTANSCPVRRAAQNTDEEVLAFLLENGAAVGGESRCGEAIVYASRRGGATCVRMLLDAGSDPNRRTYLGKTAITHAAEWGDAAVVRLLLDAGADPSVRDGLGRSAVDYALPRDDEEGAAIVELLEGRR